jgi:hypothetical protein
VRARVEANRHVEEATTTTEHDFDAGSIRASSPQPNPARLRVAPGLATAPSTPEKQSPPASPPALSKEMVASAPAPSAAPNPKTEEVMSPTPQGIPGCTTAPASPALWIDDPGYCGPCRRRGAPDRRSGMERRKKLEPVMVNRRFGTDRRKNRQSRRKSLPNLALAPGQA